LPLLFSLTPKPCNNSPPSRM